MGLDLAGIQENLAGVAIREEAGYLDTQASAVNLGTQDTAEAGLQAFRGFQVKAGFPDIHPRAGILVSADCQDTADIQDRTEPLPRVDIVDIQDSAEPTPVNLAIQDSRGHLDLVGLIQVHQGSLDIVGNRVTQGSLDTAVNRVIAGSVVTRGSPD